ncbi:transporter substrate-binding domain-containing protein [Gallibacterium trehalosifermentans]|uniref:Transporter substrate-binding domain-containing protein n=1 Tax=Gallibacterium trehalosifermentans TaxID=516935 RepID=A0ABV6H2T9_9PAST
MKTAIKHYIKGTFFLSLGLIFAQSTFALTNDEAAADLAKRVNEKGTIVVGTEGTYPPFTYHDESGKLTGYDVELTRLVAQELGVKVEFKETQWDAMLSGLNNHRFDLVANQVGLTTPERRAKYDKTAEYSYSGAVIVARKGEQRVKDWADLKGLKSAQSFTSNYGELAVKNGAEIVGIDGLAQAIQLVLQKRADVTLNDRLAVLDFLHKHPNANLEIVLRDKSQPVGSGFVFNKGNQAVIEKFNVALKKLKKEGKLKELSIQFFGEDVSVLE